MLGFTPCIWWKISWFFTLPLVCTSVFIYSLWDFKPLTYLDYTYPVWGEIIGWFLALSSMLCIPGYAIYIYLITDGTFSERCQSIFRPDVTEIIQEQRMRSMRERGLSTMTPV